MTFCVNMVGVLQVAALICGVEVWTEIESKSVGKNPNVFYCTFIKQ